MLFYAAAFIAALVSASIVQWTIWWERKVMGTFTDEDWVWNLHMQRQIFDDFSQALSDCSPITEKCILMQRVKVVDSCG